MSVAYYCVNFMSHSSSASATYLWAVGPTALQFQTHDLISDRYRVVAPHICQDIQPNCLPECDVPPSSAQRYGKVFDRQLHLPRVYDVCTLAEGDLLLLDNVPIDEFGALLPDLYSVWEHSSAHRQLSWLGQILDLWGDLAEVNGTSSLLSWANIRVDDWRIRLVEVIDDSEIAIEDISWQNLAEIWRSLLPASASPVKAALTELLVQLETPDITLEDLQSALNAQLLGQLSEHPRHITIVTATETGQEPEINEDRYFPTSSELPELSESLQAELPSCLLMVCDGIAGHDDGEVASQMAIQSLQLQIRGLLTAMAENSEYWPFHIVKQQLATCIRVANNVITASNDEQGRISRERMATTLVLMLQLPQYLAQKDSETVRSQDLYLAHLGDSRAYWLTAQGCTCLTVDDDVVSREVRTGRSLYRRAQQRPDAEAITQALGIRDGATLHPTIQRLTIDTDGVLLLCSDGFSDHHFLDQHWQSFLPSLSHTQPPLETVLEELMRQAVLQNPQDNITVAIAAYRLSPGVPDLTLDKSSEALPELSEVDGDSSPTLLEEEYSVPAAALEDPVPDTEAESLRVISSLADLTFDRPLVDSDFENESPTDAPQDMSPADFNLTDNSNGAILDSEERISSHPLPSEAQISSPLDEPLLDDVVSPAQEESPVAAAMTGEFTFEDSLEPAEIDLSTEKASVAVHTTQTDSTEVPATIPEEEDSLEEELHNEETTINIPPFMLIAAVIVVFFVSVIFAIVVIGWVLQSERPDSSADPPELEQTESSEE